MQKRLSTHARVLAEIDLITKKHPEINLYSLHALLVRKLKVRLRVDYLVANLLGQPGYVIDCETKTLLRLKPQRVQASNPI